MNPKILIIGPPRCGKSTMISKLIRLYTEENYKIFGFLTPEVKKDNNREGFDVQDICSKDRFPLARVGNYNTRFTLGKYSVFVKEFENYIDTLFNIEDREINLIIIDEIGKMELYSEKFQELIKKLFKSNIPIIATIGEKMKHSVKDYILRLPNTKLLNLTRDNNEKVFQTILSLLP
ncbi:MAG: hypothetical protein EU532_05600 [Promethearchaeota archaeon]|nr:MAG: hypothetical protein EU532_05600 [Candidatus Lokiarchaeota archaeon]